MQIGYKKSTAEGLVTLLNGVNEGAQNYARGTRIRREQDQRQQDSDRSYSLRLKDDARADEANRRANDAAARDAELQPDRKRSFKADADYNETRARSAKSQADEQDRFAAQQRSSEEFESQVEIDSHRQEQAQEYKRVTGKDVPEDYWETDAQGHKPGEPGWHWTQYDPKSPIPIKVQIDFNKRASELSTLPPDATRKEKADALRRDTQKAIVDDAKNAILEEANQRALPKQEPGAKQEEQDPSLYVPPETIEKLQKLAKDPTASPDEMRKVWDTTQKSHAQELAAGEARQMAVEGLDMHAQRIAQQQADYGDMMGETDPEAFEAFRAMRHRIAESKLSGTELRNAVKTAKELLTPGPKPKKDLQNDKTGFNAGEAIKNATAALAGTPEYIQAKPEQREAMLQAQASMMMRLAQSLSGGDMPGKPSGNGPYPNTPDDQARAASSVSKETGKGSDFLTRARAMDPAANKELADKAQAAGWTKDEAKKFRDTGVAPAGKPPLQ